MGQNRDPVYYGICLARDDNDNVIGYQAFRMDRSAPKDRASTKVGEVQVFSEEGYRAARQLCWEAGEAEGIYPSSVLEKRSS